MIEKVCYVFYRHSIDTDTKALMVFDFNLDENLIVKEIADFLEKEEMDANDEYCQLQNYEHCMEAAKNIFNGGLLDLYADKYFINEVTFFQAI